MSYVSDWIVRPIWKPTPSEAKVVHQIMAECIAEGFGIRQVMEYFSVRQHYVYENVPVKKIWREKRLKQLEGKI